MPESNNDDNRRLNENIATAVALASNVATEARQQLANYHKSVLLAAEKVTAANSETPTMTDGEQKLIQASTKAASSVAGTLIEFADIAFDQMREGSKDTRDQAMNLLRKVIKLAVDDSLTGLFEGPPRVPSPTASALVLVGENSSERIYLPASTDPKKLHVRLEGDLGVSIEVTAGRNSPELLVHAEGKPGKGTAKHKATFALTGSRPSLTVRVPKQKKTISKVAVALLHLSGAHERVITLTVRPNPPPQA